MTGTRQPHPFRIFLFATIFVAGNLALPTLDILLSHRLGQENQNRVHVEQLGGCRNHAEHCVLSRLLGNLAGQAPSSVSIATHHPDTTPPSAGADQWSAPRLNQTHNHSRAPPAPLS